MENQNEKIISRLAGEVSTSVRQINSAVGLLDQGDTVPFIARYRKEVTEGLSDEQLRLLETRLDYYRQMEDRRGVILKSVEEQGKLTDELRAAITGAETKQILEDLYLPYKPKRKTKGMAAIEAGLEPLADALLADPSLVPLTEAEKYLNPDKKFPDAASVLEGCKSILQERFAVNADLINSIRDQLTGKVMLFSTVVKDKQKEGQKYSNYFDYSETLHTIPSHRALALFRGRNEGILSVELRWPDKENETVSSPHNLHEMTIAAAYGIKPGEGPGAEWLSALVRSAWRVKIWTHLETEFLQILKEKAEDEAIQVFAKNLKDLMLAAPAGPKTVIGLDPGIRTGVKVCVVDPTGKLLETDTV